MNQISHFPFHNRCHHCVTGKALEDAHPFRLDPRNDPRVSIDNFFFSRGTGDAGAKPTLNVLDALSGALFIAMLTKGEDEHAVAVAAEALRFVLLSDQEKPIKKQAKFVCDNRKHGTVLLTYLLAPT